MLALFLLLTAAGSFVHGAQDEAAVLAKLRDVYLSRIQPVETKFKYTDLGRGTVSEKEIYAKPIVTLLRPGSAANSAYTLLLDDHEHYNYDDRITVMEEGDFYEEGDLAPTDLDGILPVDAGSSCNQGFRRTSTPAELLNSVDVVDIPFTSRFIDRGYRKSCTDLVTSVFRKTDLFILVLTWNGMKLPNHLVRLFEKIDAEQSELVVVITDFKETVRPDVAEAYREVIWMIQPFFPNGGAPEVFFVSDIKGGKKRDTFFDLQKETLLKKLRSLREKTVNLKINRLFRHARQVDEHITVLQKYLEAYVTKNNELIRDLTTEPRKFGVFEECDSACQTTKDYQQFFQRNPIHEMTSLLEDCKQMAHGASAVERSLMQELLPIAAHASIKADQPNEPEKPKKGTKPKDQKAPEASKEAEKDDQSFETVSKGYNEPAVKKVKVYRKEGKKETPAVKPTEEVKKEDAKPAQKKDQFANKQEQKVTVSVPAQKPKTSISKPAPASVPVPPKKVQEPKQLPPKVEQPKRKFMKIEEKKTAPTFKKDEKVQPIPVKKEEKPKVPKTVKIVKGTKASDKTKQESEKGKKISAGYCRYRKDCVPTEIERNANGVVEIFSGLPIWDYVPGSFREVAEKLPFETEPFFEQAEELLTYLPMVYEYFEVAQRDEGSTAASWCKFRKPCRDELEKTGKVPQKFIEKMSEKIVHVLHDESETSDDNKPKCNKYRLDCQDLPQQKRAKAKKDEASKEQKVKPLKTDPPKVQTPRVIAKADMDVDDPKCRFYKPCRVKLETLEKSSSKKAAEKPSAGSSKVKAKKVDRPYSKKGSDNCRFRKSCEDEHITKSSNMRQETEDEDDDHDEKPTVPVNRPYMSGGISKCQFSKSCEHKEEKARIKVVEPASKTAIPVSRPYIGDKASESDCRFRKSCKSDTEASGGDVKKAEKKESSERKKEDSVSASRKPTTRPYLGENSLGLCRFRKSCSDEEKELEKERKAEKLRDHASEIHVVRPYSDDDEIERQCRFRKSCDKPRNTPTPKKTEEKKVKKAEQVVIRPYSKNAEHRDERYMKSSDGKDKSQLKKEKVEQKSEIKVHKQTVKQAPTERPYAKAKADDWCRSRKSCKDKLPSKPVLKETAQKKAKDVDSTKSKSRPYIDTHGKCRFRKTCTDDERRKEEKHASQKEVKTVSPPADRPYLKALKKGEPCQFRRSCKTGKPFKPTVITSDKPTKERKEEKKTPAPQKPKTKPEITKPQSKEVKKPDTPKSKRVTGKKPTTERSDDKKLQKKKYARSEDIASYANGLDAAKSKSKPEASHEESRSKKSDIEAKIQTDKNFDDVTPTEKFRKEQVKTVDSSEIPGKASKPIEGPETTKKSDQFKKGKTVKEPLKTKKAKGVSASIPSVRPYMAGSKTQHCKFNKKCSPEERVKEIKKEKAPEKTPQTPVMRPYSHDDPVKRQCQFRKSCDQKEKKAPMAKPMRADKKLDTPAPANHPYSADDNVERKCQFRKSCDAKDKKAEHHKETVKKSEKTAVTKPPGIRPYSVEDKVNRKCQFKKSCEGKVEKVVKIKVKPEMKDDSASDISPVSRPYLEDRDSRSCRFRKSCSKEERMEEENRRVKPEPEGYERHAHVFVEPQNRDCRFRKSCTGGSDGASSGEAPTIIQGDSEGASLLVGAKNLAVSVVSSFFTPSKRYPMGGVEGGDVDVEALTQRLQLARNRTVTQLLMRKLMGMAEDHEYGCNIFHKSCRTVLGMPPLKGTKVEKVKKKCRRKKKKPSV